MSISGGTFSASLAQTLRSSPPSATSAMARIGRNALAANTTDVVSQLRPPRWPTLDNARTTTMKISCAFAPVPQTPHHIALAESLGFDTAWVYDTPALQLDCWMTLAVAATLTTRITLGPGVLIPTLRHPMVTASAIATLAAMVGNDRLVVGIGTGFTGRRAMGQKPLRWADMPGHIESILALLRRETVMIEGAPAAMLHWPGQAVEGPLLPRIVLGVNGPKGLQTAAELGCGVFTSRPRVDSSYARIPSATLLAFGTVLRPGESPDSTRVVNTAGPGAAVAYHAFLEQHDGRLDSLPNSARFVELAVAIPRERRHLELHRGHLTELNDIDRRVVTGDVVKTVTPLTGTPTELRERVVQFAAAGITEIAFQPMGDVGAELRAMAEALL